MDLFCVKLYSEFVCPCRTVKLYLFPLHPYSHPPSPAKNLAQYLGMPNMNF